MNAELVKRQDRWDLYGEDGSKIASSAPNPVGKLSIKNCEAIENGYDLDDLAESLVDRETNASVDSSYRKTLEKYVKIGFQKAVETLGDKKFSEEDIRNAMERVWCWHEDNQDKDCPTLYKLISKHIQSLQQTEWDVSFNPEEKDSEGCLILKRI